MGDGFSERLAIFWIVSFWRAISRRDKIAVSSKTSREFLKSLAWKWILVGVCGAVCIHFLRRFNSDVCRELPQSHVYFSSKKF